MRLRQISVDRTPYSSTDCNKKKQHGKTDDQKQIDDQPFKTERIPQVKEYGQDNIAKDHEHDIADAKSGEFRLRYHTRPLFFFTVCFASWSS